MKGLQTVSTREGLLAQHPQKPLEAPDEFPFNAAPTGRYEAIEPVHGHETVGKGSLLT
jgi:hypothetical protein